MLGSRPCSETLKTKLNPAGLGRVPLFWKSNCLDPCIIYSVPYGLLTSCEDYFTQLVDHLVERFLIKNFKS